MKLRPNILALLLFAPVAVLAAQDAPRASDRAARGGAGLPLRRSERRKRRRFVGRRPRDRLQSSISTIGHYYQVEYEVSSSSDDAGSPNRTISRKAFELDPSSDVIGEQLAEMFFNRSAFATRCLKRRASSSAIPTIWARGDCWPAFTLRTLGDLSETASQMDTVQTRRRAVQRNSASGTARHRFALWLARLDRLQRQARRPGTDAARHFGARSGERRRHRAVDAASAAIQQRGAERSDLRCSKESSRAARPRSFTDLLGRRGNPAKRTRGKPKTRIARGELDPDDSRHPQRTGPGADSRNRNSIPRRLSSISTSAKWILPNPDRILPPHGRKFYKEMHQLDKPSKNVLKPKSATARENLEVVYVKSAIYGSRSAF